VPYLRKKSSISALILLSFFFISYISQALVFAESSKNVKDYLNYLTAEEIASLQSDIDSIKRVTSLMSSSLLPITPGQVFPRFCG